MSSRHSPMVPLPYTVLRRRQETEDTFTLELVPAHDAAPFSFVAGQFNMLTVYGAGEIPISISGNPAQPEVIVHTTRVVGSVTKAMRLLTRGDLIGVRGPFGVG